MNDKQKELICRLWRQAQRSAVRDQVDNWFRVIIACDMAMRSNPEGYLDWDFLMDIARVEMLAE
jgi:hypothetical protein